MQNAGITLPKKAISFYLLKGTVYVENHFLKSEVRFLSEIES